MDCGVIAMIWKDDSSSSLAAAGANFKLTLLLSPPPTSTQLQDILIENNFPEVAVLSAKR